MSHFADSHWHPLVGTYTSNSVTGITWTTTATVNRGTFTTPTIEHGYSLNSSDAAKRPYRVSGIIMTTTVGTKGSGSDQDVKVQLVYNNGMNSQQTIGSASARVTSSTSTVNTVRFDIFVWLLPGTTCTVQTKTTGATLGNGAAGTYRIDYTVEAI